MNDLDDAAWHQAALDEWQQRLEKPIKIPARPSTDYEPVPAGNHVAICNAIVDLGLQPGSAIYPDPKPQIWIRFELPTERVKYNKEGVEQEGPMTIHRKFTASMSEKANLRKFIESWFGKKFPNDDLASDFDVEKLLGKKCLLNVTHAEKGTKLYANIANATPIPKGMNADYPQVNPSLYFEIATSSDADFAKLPDWIKEKITNRLREEPKKARETAAVIEDFDDEIPF
jgi:hypothetical protein